MLDCNACIRRCVRTIFADVLNRSSALANIPPRLSTTSRRSSQAICCQRRAYASAVRCLQKDQPQNERLSPSRYGTGRPFAVGKDQEFKVTSLEQELRYLKDPLKLADHTISLLRQDDHKKAVEIVRLGSRRMACTVSWNHLVDYEMSKGRVTGAMSLYNEMKKRAQQPDAHTYTIVLRGLSWHPHYEQSLPRALSVYHSMYAENCPVKPSIIHTNAVLRVCALARDLDALWGVAAKLPTHGKGAPNNLTFTTILNAVRTIAWNDGSEDAKNMDETVEERAARRQRAVMQGRKMWDEIIGRWRGGDMLIDEELVCSMGRLLLLGRAERDYDDVLSLLEQTMAIPRQIPRLGKPARGSYLSAAEVQSEDMKPELHQSTTGSDSSLEAISFASDGVPEPSSDEDLDTDYSPGGEFDVVSQPASRSSSYAFPGRNTLSLVVDACLRMQAVRPAQDYWGLLTAPSGPYNIVPDAENYHMYLRLLRVQRASRLSVELVQEMRRGLTGRTNVVQAKTFRIALSCCVRDKNNRNVLEHAGKLVRMMQDTLEEPDVRSLEMYISVALHRKGRDWRSIMGVLRGTEVGVRNLRSLLAYVEKGKRETRKSDVMEFVRKLIGAYDIVITMGAEEMGRDERQLCMEQRNTLASWLTRQANGGPGLMGREGKGIEEPRPEGRKRSDYASRKQRYPVPSRRVDRRRSNENEASTAMRAETGGPSGAERTGSSRGPPSWKKWEKSESNGSDLGRPPSARNAETSQSDADTSRDQDPTLPDSN